MIGNKDYEARDIGLMM